MPAREGLEETLDALTWCFSLESDASSHVCLLVTRRGCGHHACGHILGLVRVMMGSREGHGWEHRPWRPAGLLSRPYIAGDPEWVSSSVKST